MESARQGNLTHWRTRLAARASWFGGPGAKGLAEALAAVRQRIKKYRGSGPVVVAEIKPAAYLAGVLAAVEKKLPVVLANPRWGRGERAQAAAQIKPGLWLGDNKARWPAVKLGKAFDGDVWAEAILIPTGGTGGRVRWAVHTWGTLVAAARAQVKFFEAEGCVHVSTLPSWHVGGLMPAVRALETGGTLWLENWKSLEAGQPPKIPPGNVIISLVPTQLHRLLMRKAMVAWLSGTRAILLGGAAPTAELLRRSRKMRLPVALAYGMTETAAVVAAQRPEDFLAGEPPVATPLPHAKIWAGDQAGKRLRSGEKGRLWIQASSLFSGYYPAKRAKGPFGTEDCGVVDKRGRVRPLGRMDRVIITGGEKVHPAEVEREIRATGLVKDVRVIGLPDAEWGERVVAIFTGNKRVEKKLRAALAGRLASHAQPKEWLWVKKLPRGKEMGGG